MNDHYVSKEHTCFVFGSVSGCREECPVFQNGECERQEENENLFNRETTR